MFWFLPLVSFAFLFLTFRKRAGDGRDALLAAAVVWAVVLTAITEGLSFFGLITFGWVSAAWIFVGIVSLLIYFLLSPEENQAAESGINFAPLSSSPVILLVGTVFIAATVGLIALVAAPNNGDAMAYHLGRVVHWIQNHSVAHYPTSLLRQVYLNPWAEFALLHFQILSGGDRLANLVQWFSMVGSLAGVSLIAKQFGADTRGQVFAAAVCVSIPMGICQASSAQNDYAVSFWLVCFVYYLTLLKKRPDWIYSLAVGASLGLAVLTKATAYIYAFPFLVLFALSGLKTLRWKLWKPVVVIAFSAFFINLGHYARNFDLFGSPIGTSQEGEYRLVNDVFTSASLFSNVTRNIALHLGTPFESVNYIAERDILFLHKLFGIDIDDPRTTWVKENFYVPKLSSGEDNAGNPVHFILILFSVFLFFRYRRKNDLSLGSYAIALAIGFLLFCLYLKWQPWHSRLHLPLFVLWSPFIAVILARMHGTGIANLILIILTAFSLPWVFYDYNHPVIKGNNIFNTPRIDQYFSASPQLREPYLAAAEFLKWRKCADVGLAFDSGSREYPLWVLLQSNADKTFRIEHFNVRNISAVKENIAPFNQFDPCTIISDGGGQEGEMFIKNDIYVREFSSGLISIFVRK